MLFASVPTNPLFWISFITGLLGAICIAVYTYPSMIQTVRTKNTTGIPVIMFTILGLGSFFFLINGVTGIVYNWAGTWTVWAVLIGLAIANLFSFVSAVITMTLKVRNIILAKKYHMTEAQLCDRLARLAGIRGYRRGDDPERAKFTVDKKLAEKEQKRDATLIRMKKEGEAGVRLNKIKKATGKQPEKIKKIVQESESKKAKPKAKTKKH